jgi:hypothetical protein
MSLSMDGRAPSAAAAPAAAPREKGPPPSVIDASSLQHSWTAFYGSGKLQLA